MKKKSKYSCRRAHITQTGVKWRENHQPRHQHRCPYWKECLGCFEMKLRSAMVAMPKSRGKKPSLTYAPANSRGSVCCWFPAFYTFISFEWLFVLKPEQLYLLKYSAGALISGLFKSMVKIPWHAIYPRVMTSNVLITFIRRNSLPHHLFSISLLNCARTRIDGRVYPNW